MSEAATETRGAIVFAGEGSVEDHGWVWFVVVFGVIGALTMMCVAFAMPEVVGRWWIWAAAIAPFVLLARWMMKRSRVAIRLVAIGDALQLTIHGPAAALDTPLAPAYERWATGERIPLKQGGGTMMHFSVIVVGAEGRRIGFRAMGGRDADGWPMRSPRLRGGADVFSTFGIHALDRALAEHADAHPRGAAASAAAKNGEPVASVAT